MVFVITGACEYVVSTRRQPDDVEEPSVCPRSGSEFFTSCLEGTVYGPLASMILLHPHAQIFIVHACCIRLFLRDCHHDARVLTPTVLLHFCCIFVEVLASEE